MVRRMKSGRLAWRIASGRLHNKTAYPLRRSTLAVEHFPLSNCWLCPGAFQEAASFLEG